MTTIVLLPGMDGTGDLFDDFVSELKAKSFVVSYPTDQPLGYAELEKWVLASLPQEGSFILLGESFSGPLAIAIAAKRLPHLRALILVCSFAKLPVPPLSVFLQRIVSAFPFWRAPASLTARTVLGRFHTGRLQERLASINGRIAPKVWRARFRAVLAVDHTALLGRIDVPLLYLRATHDKVVFRPASGAISRHVPTAKIVEIEGPHFLLQTKTKESVAAIKAFAREHGIAL